MYCSHCGSELSDNAYICTKCGANTQNNVANEKDTGSAGWFWLGFFIPLAGFIIWVFTYDSTPKNAKKAVIGSIIGTVSVIAAVIFFYIFFFALMFWAIS